MSVPDSIVERPNSRSRSGCSRPRRDVPGFSTTAPPYLGSVTGTVASTFTIAISTVLLASAEVPCQSIGTCRRAHLKSPKHECQTKCFDGTTYSQGQPYAFRAGPNGHTSSHWKSLASVAGGCDNTKGACCFTHTEDCRKRELKRSKYIVYHFPKGGETRSLREERDTYGF